MEGKVRPLGTGFDVALEVSLMAPTAFTVEA